jgi:hypothetical protein
MPNTSLGLGGAVLAFTNPYFVDRFSIFQGVLRFSGWLHSPDAKIRHLALKVPGGSEYSIRFGQESPDLVPVFGKSATHSRFDATIAFADPRSAIVASQLLIHFENGTSASISNLGRPTGSLTTVFSQRLEGMSCTTPEGPRRLLEIGSRARSGVVRRGIAPAGWVYSGFDVLDGPNVDVVGDAHQLSRSYPSDYFDGVMAFSVLEHLMMPWKVMIEINRIMKVGAIGIFSTHQCWPLHDQPWDFWRFSDQSWTALVNKPLGFEIVETRMEEPAYVVAARCHPVTDFAEVAESFLSSSVIFRKIGHTNLEWPVDLEQITDTHYPTATTTLPN